MRIFFIGDIIGKPGRKIVQHFLPKFRKEKQIDFIIANGENAAGGFGLTEKIYKEIIISGVNLITSGNHIWDKKEIEAFLKNSDLPLLRPANYLDELPGRGLFVYKFPENSVLPPVYAVNIQGRAYMIPIECPFRTMDKIISEINEIHKSHSTAAPIIFVDFHAEATAEKAAMGHYLDGRVSVLAGTHTHIQTNDGRVLPKGTAYITDAGMTGSRNSVIGFCIDNAVKKFITGKPHRLDVIGDDPYINGFIAEIDNNTGKAVSCEAVNMPFDYSK